MKKVPANNHGKSRGNELTVIRLSFELASWISVVFKLYLIKKFQRLKGDKNPRLFLASNLNHTRAKINFGLPQVEEEPE